MRPAKHRWAIGAQVIIPHTDGTILLTKRADNGQWVLPGGTVDPEEDIHTAAIREVVEEVGIRVATVQFLGVYPKALKEDIVFTFVAEDWEGKPALSDEVVDVCWVDLQSMPREYMPKNVIERVEHYFQP